MPRGRRLLRDEMLMHKVIDLSWATLFQGLKSELVPLREKLDVAKTIAAKSIPKDINIKMKDPFKIEIHTKPFTETLKDVTNGLDGHRLFSMGTAPDRTEPVIPFAQ